MSRRLPDSRSERAALVGLIAGRAKRSDADRSMAELAGLAHAAGVVVVLTVLQERNAPDPATFLGRGKLDQLASACDETGADLLIFDDELTPAQLRHIEERVARRVVDRTQLILDIFARRAKTREGKLQVELAQLKYLLPRLVGAGAALSRLGGGIGTRGPGETQLETDRRRTRTRIHAIAKDIELVRRRRAQLRERRQRASVPVVALVGYTNAGKTTLFNRLTREQAEASNALFVTLDPLIRPVRLPDRRELLVSDTVGFIDRLPHTLVAAFRATLEEVAASDLILHVIDAADSERDRHVGAVERVLDEVGAADVPLLSLFNKCDLLPREERERLLAADASALVVSALTGDGCDELLEIVASRLALDHVRVSLDFARDDETAPARIARLYRHARVLTHVASDERITIEADIPRRLLDGLTGRGSEKAAKRTQELRRNRG